MHMSFLASPELAADIERFNKQASSGHVAETALINDIAERFVDEMLTAFFTGPMDALKAEGPMVNIINGVANVVGKAAKGLTKRLLAKTDREEQAGLARHFESISIVTPQGKRLGFPITGAMAQRMTTAFTTELEAEANKNELLAVMHAITDGAIASFMDASVAQLKVGMLTRGLVATARGTIRTASHSASNHMMSLPHKQRRLVIKYFQSMLTD